MKKYLLIITIFLLFPLSQVHAAFSQYRSITVQSAQVPSTQTNFPMLVSATYTYLKTIANGGKVVNTNGYDVGFYSNSNCSTGKLNWETEKYVATTGEVDYWINIASISNGTVIYMCYGDSTISTDQSNKTAVWDTNYKGVWHLPDGTTLTANDSTGNGNNGTITNSPTATTGKVDGAANFVSGSSQYIQDSFANQPQGNSSTTVSAWVNLVNSSGGYDMVSFYGLDSASNRSGYYLYRHPTGYAYAEFGSGYGGVAGTTILSPSTWYYMVGVYDGTSNKIYINGALEGTTAFSAGNFGGNKHDIGAYQTLGGTPSLFLNGVIDEHRISNVARSANWITTEYNNQSVPSSFYAVGLEISISGNMMMLGMSF